MKEIEKSETRERRGRTLSLPLHTYFTLFITILIGLNYPTFLFYMSGQKDIFVVNTSSRRRREGYRHTSTHKTQALSGVQ